MFDISKLFHLAWFQRIHSMISQVLAKIKDEQHEERMEKHIDVECKSKKTIEKPAEDFPHSNTSQNSAKEEWFECTTDSS